MEGKSLQLLRGMRRVSNITSNHAYFAIISVSHAGSNAAELCARMLIRAVCEVTMMRLLARRDVVMHAV